MKSDDFPLPLVTYKFKNKIFDIELLLDGLYISLAGVITLTGKEFDPTLFEKLQKLYMCDITRLFVAEITLLSSTDKILEQKTMRLKLVSGWWQQDSLILYINSVGIATTTNPKDDKNAWQLKCLRLS
jgi:hypothetical protein